MTEVEREMGQRLTRDLEAARHELRRLNGMVVSHGSPFHPGQLCAHETCLDVTELIQRISDTLTEAYTLQAGMDCVRASTSATDRDRIEQLKAAGEAILAEPYGCSLCDSGKPRTPAKGHQPDCPYERLRAALAEARGANSTP